MGAGLDIGSYSLKLCEATAGWTGLRLRRHAELRVPEGLLRPSPEEENVADPAAFRELLAQLLAQWGRRPPHVRVAISDLAARVRIVGCDALPVDPEEARRYVLWRLRPELGFPPEEARVDYVPLGPGPGETGRRLLCLASHRKVVGQYEGLLEEAGLRVSALAPSSALLFNLFDAFFLPGPRRLEKPLLLNLGYTSSTLVMAQNGVPVFWRSLPIGGADFLAATPDAGKADPERQERRAGAKRMLQDILDSIAFCAEECGIERPDRLVLAGGLANNPRLGVFLSQKVGIPAEVLNPQAVIRPGKNGPDAGWVAWSAALAAAARV